MNLISNHNLYPEIVDRLEKKTHSVRWDYIIRPKLHPGETLAERPHLAKRGNVAVCELVLENGEQFEVAATSKKNPVNMPGIKNGPSQIFVPREDRSKRDHEGYYKLNTTDPEISKRFQNTNLILGHFGQFTPSPSHLVTRPEFPHDFQH